MTHGRLLVAFARLSPTLTCGSIPRMNYHELAAWFASFKSPTVVRHPGGRSGTMPRGRQACDAVPEDREEAQYEKDYIGTRIAAGFASAPTAQGQIRVAVGRRLNQLDPRRPHRRRYLRALVLNGMTRIPTPGISTKTDVAVS